MREIELRCDGVALITLNRLGLAPARLMTAGAKLNQANHENITLLDAPPHPSAEERGKFNIAMTELLKSKSPGSLIATRHQR